MLDWFLHYAEPVIEVLFELVHHAHFMRLVHRVALVGLPCDFHKTVGGGGLGLFTRLLVQDLHLPAFHSKTGLDRGKPLRFTFLKEILVDLHELNQVICFLL